MSDGTMKGVKSSDEMKSSDDKGLLRLVDKYGSDAVMEALRELWRNWSAKQRKKTSERSQGVC